MNEAINLAVQLHRSGHLSDAETIYRQILQAVPDQPDALHFLGLLAHQLGRSEEAVRLIRKAILSAPHHADAHNNLGNVLKERGCLDEAEASFRTAISLVPNHAASHNNLGVLLKEKGNLIGAIAEYEQAIALEPDYVEARHNLGNALAEQDKLSEAVAAYQKVVALAPGHAEAHFQLGKVYGRQGRKEEALAEFRQTTALQSQHASAHFELGNTLAQSGLYGDAIEAYRKVIECDRRLTTAYKNLGNLLNMFGRTDEAEAVWQQWLEVDPDNPIARHMVAAATGQKTPERAEDEYVKQIFDGFARSFDERLQQLNYRAPELITEAIARELGPPAGQLDVLDAGCGTGLCAPLLRPYARRLSGVDLSAGMLEKARERGGYDELVTQELTAFLRGTPGCCDLIASADTLVYFGDLNPVLQAAHTALRPGGCLVFTLERLAPGQPVGEFRLHPLGRYSHSEEYVRRSLSDAGFSLRGIVPADLRMEGGKSVAGLVVVARKPPAA